MGKTEDMFDEMLNETESFFIPSDDGKKERTKSDFAPNVDGEFLGHLQEASCKEVSWTKQGKKYKAVVYNYQFIVAKENENNSYTLSNGDSVTGDKYVGRAYRNAGVFRFLEAVEGEDHVSNPEGNKNYLWFCQTLDMEIPRKVVKINDQDVEVQVLPQLMSDDINGKPALAVIGKGKPYKNKEGQERTPYEGKYLKHWKEGVKKDADIPF